MDKFLLNKKIDSPLFKDYFTNLLKEIGDKKVLIYGAGYAFQKLEKMFNLTKLNIVAISDINFTENGEYCGIKSIPPSTINDYDVDAILMTLISPDKASEYLQKKLKINKNIEIKKIWDNLIPQENDFIEYLEKINFEQHLKKLTKKLKNKKIVIYGAGVFFQTIKQYYDLSKLNIVAISDKKFKNHETDEKFLNYPVCSPAEIKDFSPSYVLIAVRYFLDVMEDLDENVLKGLKIKTLPLVKKPFWELIKEIWA